MTNANQKTASTSATNVAPISAPVVVLASIRGTYMKEDYTAELVIDVPKKGEATGLRVNYTRGNQGFTITDKECVEAFLSKGFNRQIADSETTEAGVLARLQVMSEGFISQKKKATYENSLIAKPTATGRGGRVAFPFETLLEVLRTDTTDTGKARVVKVRELGDSVVRGIVMAKDATGAVTAPVWLHDAYVQAVEMDKTAKEEEAKAALSAGIDALAGL